VSRVANSDMLGAAGEHQIEEPEAPGESPTCLPGAGEAACRNSERHGELLGHGAVVRRQNRAISKIGLDLMDSGSLVCELQDTN
jgi:hypothetical protein